MMTVGIESTRKKLSTHYGGKKVEIECVLMEKAKRSWSICEQDDFYQEFPIWVPKRHARVVEGKMSVGEVITIEMPEDLALDLNISY